MVGSKNAGGNGDPSPNGNAPWLDTGAAVPPWDEDGDAESGAGSGEPPESDAGVFLDTQGPGAAPLASHPGAFCCLPRQREEPSPSAVHAFRRESSLTSPRSSLRSSPSVYPVPGLRHFPDALLAMLSWFSHPWKNSPPASWRGWGGVKSYFLRLGLWVPVIFREGFGLFLPEHLSKSIAAMPRVQRCKSQAGWVDPAHPRYRSGAPGGRPSLASTPLWNKPR